LAVEFKQEKTMMSTANELQQTIDAMVDEHRGILAADESAPTIKKRFDAINQLRDNAPWQLSISYGRAAGTAETRPF
jgi:fructose-bisphosphate aldolase class 1